MTSRLSTLAGLALLAFGLSSLPALASSALIVKPVHALGGPGTTFAAVLDLGANSKVGILWCGPVTFDWCLVQFHKKQGWVHAGDLLALSDCDGVAHDIVLAGLSARATGDGLCRPIMPPAPRAPSA